MPANSIPRQQQPRLCCFAAITSLPIQHLKHDRFRRHMPRLPSRRHAADEAMSPTGITMIIIIARFHDCRCDGMQEFPSLARYLRYA